MDKDKEREELKEAAQILLEKRWLLRQSDSEAYFLVRRHEKRLREYFREKCGWQLLVNARYYKLEKIPSEPRPFMGIDNMQSPGDYALLCCVLAFLEEQEVDGMFLLGGLCEALLDFYPQDAATGELNWESYNWRKSLIRVMNFLLDEGVLRVIEDESEAFLQKGRLADGAMAGEALYEVTPLARIFLRSYHRPLQGVTIEELCSTEMEQDLEEERQAGARRRRIYRQLLLQPACYRTEETEADFDYLRHMNRRVREELEERLDLHLELYRDSAMLVAHERPSWFKDIFPVRMRGLHDIILHLSGLLRNKKAGAAVWTQAEMEAKLEELFQQTGSGWTKEYREMSRRSLTQEVLTELCGWNMARIDGQGLIHLQPALYRLSGRYPEDYQGGNAKTGEQVSSGKGVKKRKGKEGRTENDE